MILVGLNGGQRQGKSTVGEELRRLAGVDAKADLEFSYPIGQVVNAWVQQWPVELLESGKPTIDVANKLIPLIAEPVKKVTGMEIDVNRLLIEDTDASCEEANRLLSYLEKYIEAGAQRSEEFPLPINPNNKVLHRACYQWVGARLIDEVDAGEGHDIWTRVIERRITTLQDRGYTLVTVGGTRYPIQQEMIRRNGGIIIEVERPGVALDNDVTEQADARKNYDVKVINNGTLEQLNAVVGRLYKDLAQGNAQKVYEAKV
jgi:hypothetical protein